LSQDEKSVEVEQKPKPKKKHWILWTLVVVFILASMGVMFAADYFYAPDAKTTAPGAPEN